MSEAYCKWPAIIGIIIACVIVISVIWCCARCLCCGAECCCGCLSCFNSCCPSPRRRNQGYQQPPPQPYGQYQSPQPPMMYGAGAYGYRGPQTATFDVTSKKNNAGGLDEDALPAMPAWDHTPNKHVEEDDVAMEQLNHNAAQRESLLPRDNHNGYYGNDISQAGDLGTMQAGPYQRYDAHQQYVGSPVSTAPSTMYPPTYHTRPQSSVYEPVSASPYAASVPPSYRTAPPSIASPHPQPAGIGGIGRKPVAGTWRDV